jgi:mannose-6-phosphate isomerase-like protein (cupin superfamily)
MSEFTVVNLKEVEDQAPRFGHAPDLEARFATGPLGLSNSGISYQRLAPNFRMPFGHRHRTQEEVYAVLAGGGRMKLDDEVVELRALDAVRIPPGAMRSIEAGPEGIEILAIGAPNTGAAQSDVIDMTPNWWAD